ncbi:MAG: hypothetical protein K8R16_08555, partial [Anaerolineales bacterium]|nr:hypothetical protein [Anaerolineales bacterium]
LVIRIFFIGPALARRRFPIAYHAIPTPRAEDRGERARVKSYHPSLSPMLLPRDQAMAGLDLFSP